MNGDRGKKKKKEDWKTISPENTLQFYENDPKVYINYKTAINYLEVNVLGEIFISASILDFGRYRPKHTNTVEISFGMKHGSSLYRLLFQYGIFRPYRLVWYDFKNLGTNSSCMRVRQPWSPVSWGV